MTISMHNIVNLDLLCNIVFSFILIWRQHTQLLKVMMARVSSHMEKKLFFCALINVYTSFWHALMFAKRSLGNITHMLKVCETFQRGKLTKLAMNWRYKRSWKISFLPSRKILHETSACTTGLYHLNERNTKASPQISKTATQDTRTIFF